MGNTTIVLHALVLLCCLALTHQASLDNTKTKRSVDQRAVDLREEDGLFSPVETSEEVVDREERASGCQFECAAGEKAVQNESSIPRANGCGPYGIKLSFVDEAAEDCCKAHDYCYEICGKSRLDCDVMLRDCIKGLRKKRDVSRVKRGWHSMMASVFYRTVRTFGCKAYKRGQTRGCMCVQDENYDPSKLMPVQDGTGPEEKGRRFRFSMFPGF